MTARAAAAWDRSAATTEKPSAAKPRACVPMPHATSRTDETPSPHVSLITASSMGAWRRILASQSSKMRWYSGASSV